jgi:hypothetical protein
MALYLFVVVIVFFSMSIIIVFFLVLCCKSVIIVQKKQLKPLKFKKEVRVLLEVLEKRVWKEFF